MTAPRPYVGRVPVHNATAGDVLILGRDHATLIVGPVEFYMPSDTPLGEERRRVQLEAIVALGAAITDAANRSLTAMSPLPWAVA